MNQSDAITRPRCYHLLEVDEDAEVRQFKETQESSRESLMAPAIASDVVVSYTYVANAYK